MRLTCVNQCGRIIVVDADKLPSPRLPITQRLLKALTTISVVGLVLVVAAATGKAED